MSTWEIPQQKDHTPHLDSMTNDELEAFIKQEEERIHAQDERLDELTEMVNMLLVDQQINKLREDFPDINLSSDVVLPPKEIASNRDEMDKVLDEDDREQMLENSRTTSGNSDKKTFLARLATLRDKGVHTAHEKLTPMIQKFKDNFWKITLAGGITLSIAGFTKSEQGQTVYDYTHSLSTKHLTEHFDSESTPAKLALYVNQAPWLSPDKLVDFFTRTYDTYKRSKGENLEEAVPLQETKPSLQQKLYEHADSLRIQQEKEVQDSISASHEKIELNTSMDNAISRLGGPQHFERYGTAKTWVGTRYENSEDGSFARTVTDLSDGLYVRYQPRNEKNYERTTINDALYISDYLYDMDMSDDFQHQHASNELAQLRKAVESGNLKNNSKFVQVREADADKPGIYKTYIKPTSELTADDFNNNIYRQSWATLSDLDLSDDLEKIRLTNYSKKLESALFQNQGLPFHAGTKNNKGNPHNLRLPGGLNNYGKYQDIDHLDQYGAYLGATVTVISDDGMFARKITGSLRDIVKTAIALHKKTNEEVHFLQSDAGSMNIKALAKNYTLTPNDMDITRNQEPQAGGSEIVITEQ